jgi:hypothetical protein
MLKAVGRLFVSVAVFAVLNVPTASFPNDRVAGVMVAWATPLPVSVTVCGLLLALSVIVKVPVSVPKLDAANTTLMVHLAPAPNDVPHVFVCE